MQVSGHFLPLEYSCCNLLHNCKDTLFTPASGLFGTVFLRNTAKPLFSSFVFLLCLAKLQVIYNGITCKIPTCFQLAARIIYLQLTYRARTACTLRRRPPTILQARPLQYIVSVCQFCLCYSSELRCKGTNIFANVQAISKINAYSLTFIITTMSI